MAGIMAVTGGCTYVWSVFQPRLLLKSLPIDESTNYSVISRASHVHNFYIQCNVDYKVPLNGSGVGYVEIYLYKPYLEMEYFQFFLWNFNSLYSTAYHNTVFLLKVACHVTSYRDPVPHFLQMKRRGIGPTCSLDFEWIWRLIGKYSDALIKSDFP